MSNEAQNIAIAALSLPSDHTLPEGQEVSPPSLEASVSYLTAEVRELRTRVQMLEYPENYYGDSTGLPERLEIAIESLGDRMGKFSESIQDTKDELDDLRDRLHTAECELSNHDFALFNPYGRVESCFRRSSGKGYQLFGSICLGSLVLIAGCTLAASISIDAKQRSELSTAVACTSAAAAWALTMRQLLQPSESP